MRRNTYVCPFCFTIALVMILLIGKAHAALPVADLRGKVDEYGNIPIRDEKVRLDKFAFALRDEPGAVGHIIVYAGRYARKGEAQAQARRARDYLVKCGIKPERIIWQDGGYREQRTVELYIRPRGTAAPLAVPTVDPHQVQIIKNTKPKRRKRSGKA